MDSKYGLQKLKRYNHRLHNHNKPYAVKQLVNCVTSFRSQGSLVRIEGDSADSDTQLTKLDVVLTFQLEVKHTPASLLETGLQCLYVHYRWL